MQRVRAALGIVFVVLVFSLACVVRPDSGRGSEPSSTPPEDALSAPAVPAPLQVIVLDPGTREVIPGAEVLWATPQELAGRTDSELLADPLAYFRPIGHVTHTDAMGQATLPQLSAGSWIYAHAPLLGMLKAWTETDRSPLTLQLGFRSEPLSVRTIDVNGNPVGGVMVFFNIVNDHGVISSNGSRTAEGSGIVHMPSQRLTTSGGAIGGPSG